MKSLRIYSYESRIQKLKNRYSLTKRDTSFTEKPTPLDFDSFIPWFCLELQVPRNVIVKRTSQAPYVRYDRKLSKDNTTKVSKSKSRSTKIKLSTSQVDIEEKRISSLPKVSFVTSTVDINDAILVTTCYDTHGRLVEVQIVGCPVEIPRKVIQAFSLCLPFHPQLSKLGIRKGGLCQNILYEISKLLLQSNITEICLDDSSVPEGNYSILLDPPSQIKYLSLKRCGINDVECKKIASKLDLKGPALKILLLLDLTSNNIMDEGAQALGEILKSNRHLMYLNLSGNKISDGGASYILRYLQEFPLSHDDLIQIRRRQLGYLKSRSIIYEKRLKEEKLACLVTKSIGDSHVTKDNINLSINVPEKIRRKKSKRHVPSFTVEETTVEAVEEKKTKEIMGELEDLSEERYIKCKGDLVYSTGNLTLTSLNLAYNNLSLLSLRKILRILKYQCGINKSTRNAGLVRVVIDGNNIPSECNELYEIDICLKRAALQSEHSFMK